MDRKAKSAQADMLRRIEANFRDEGQRVTVVWTGKRGGKRMREQALKEIRRRLETATEKARVQLKLIEQMIETGSPADAVGQIIDESGNTWDYAIDFKSILAEGVGHGLPLIRVDRHRGSVDLFQRYAKAVNKRLVLNEREKELVCNHIIEAASIGGFEY